MAKKAKSYENEPEEGGDSEWQSTREAEAEAAAALPTADEEFVFDGSLDSLPSWIDRSCAGINTTTNKPLIWVPMHDFPDEGQPFRDQPYSTKAANIGDTVKFVVRKGPRPAHIEVIVAEPEEEVVE